jgi:hypothetical protein
MESHSSRNGGGPGKCDIEDYKIFVRIPYTGT